jgi:hypothetical protein
MLVSSCARTPHLASIRAALAINVAGALNQKPMAKQKGLRQHILPRDSLKESPSECDAGDDGGLQVKTLRGNRRRVTVPFSCLLQAAFAPFERTTLPGKQVGGA